MTPSRSSSPQWLRGTLISPWLYASLRSCVRSRSPLLAIGLLAGCADNGQSALHTAGRDAEQILSLFWLLLIIAAVVWLAVVALLLYVAVSRRTHSRRTGVWLIAGGGAVVPTVVLAGLLIYSLPLFPALSDVSGATLRVEVAGEQWWWRVRYPLADGGSVELANEIRLPVDERVLFSLSSPDVIHSFWIPALGGKVDMVPGRNTRLALTPTRTGTWRGVCAEYCGSAHAQMAFTVVVMERPAFDRWLAQQAAPARPAGDHPGYQAFLANGCGACHAVRGTPADGRVGPDLTHVGSRLSLGAGILPNDAATLARWIADPAASKPDARMPGFGMLPQAQLNAMARWLKELQ